MPVGLLTLLPKLDSPASVLTACLVPAATPICCCCHQVATFTRDTERLQANLEKIRSEIRWVFCSVSWLYRHHVSLTS